MLIVKAMLRREALLMLRHWSDLVTVWLFFIIVVSLFPLAIGQEQALLRTIAPGIIWVAALLSTLLGLNRLFKDDEQDASLEWLLLSGYPLSILISIKLLWHIVVQLLPLILITPFFALMMYLPLKIIPLLITTLCLGIPTLILLGALASALTLSLTQNTLFITVIIVPLSIPLLIFATGTIINFINNQSVIAPLAWLSVMFVLCASLIPFVLSWTLTHLR